MSPVTPIAALGDARVKITAAEDRLASLGHADPDVLWLLDSAAADLASARDEMGS